ncbi:hypothetical protein NJB1604_39690 [Mycobacterium marinum]|nr:hypothetical protein NJB1604_39690 [Mycobacterium marinum]
MNFYLSKRAGHHSEKFITGLINPWATSDLGCVFDAVLILSTDWRIVIDFTREPREPDAARA